LVTAAIEASHKLIKNIGLATDEVRTESELLTHYQNQVVVTMQTTLSWYLHVNANTSQGQLNQRDKEMTAMSIIYNKNEHVEINDLLLCET
jgi:hypothetical protein